MLWAGVTGVMLLLGFLVARKRAPELKQIEQADTEMEMILYLAESDAPGGASLFSGVPRKRERSGPKDNEVYITFYSPRVGGSAAQDGLQPFPLPAHQDQPLSPDGRAS